jgi:hypothetical protein
VRRREFYGDEAAAGFSSNDERDNRHRYGFETVAAQDDDRNCEHAADNCEQSPHRATSTAEGSKKEPAEGRVDRE